MLIGERGAMKVLKGGVRESREAGRDEGECGGKNNSEGEQRGW